MATGSFAAEAKAAIESLRKTYIYNEETTRNELVSLKRTLAETYNKLDQLTAAKTSLEDEHSKYLKLVREADAFKFPDETPVTDTEEPAVTKKYASKGVYKCSKCSGLGHFAKTCPNLAAKSS